MDKSDVFELPDDVRAALSRTVTVIRQLTGQNFESVITALVMSSFYSGIQAAPRMKEIVERLDNL